MYLLQSKNPKSVLQSIFKQHGLTNGTLSDLTKYKKTVTVLSYKTHKSEKVKQKIKYKFVTPFLCFQIASGNAFKGLNEENGKQK